MRMIAIGLAAAVVACDPTSPSPPPSGTYTLQTVDGQALPFRYHYGTDPEIYVVGGSITFSSGNRALFTELFRERRVGSNEWSDSRLGFGLQYAWDGRTLTVTGFDGVLPGAPTLSLSEDRITVTLGHPIDPHRHDGQAHRFVFRRD